jgi:hypothetical protein
MVYMQLQLQVEILKLYTNGCIFAKGTMWKDVMVFPVPAINKQKLNNIIRPDII